MILKEVPADFKPRFEVSGCFVEAGGKILLLKAGSHKAHGGRWGVPAGKAESGESALEACLREAREETGLLLIEERIEGLGSIAVRHGGYDFNYHMFRIRFDAAPEVAIDPKEHDEFKWATPVEAIRDHVLIEDEDECVRMAYPEAASARRKRMTLCFVHDGERVLLGMKKRGFGAGRWNGFGGKVAPDESIEDAVARELKEEAGIEADGMSKSAVIDFQFAAKPEEILEVHVYRIHGFRGEPVESEEMRPEWYHVSAIPFDSMWPDDRHWLPHYLDGKKLRAKFLFGDGDAVLEQSIEPVEAL